MLGSQSGAVTKVLYFRSTSTRVAWRGHSLYKRLRHLSGVRHGRSSRHAATTVTGLLRESGTT